MDECRFNFSIPLITLPMNKSYFIRYTYVSWFHKLDSKCCLRSLVCHRFIYFSNIRILLIRIDKTCPYRYNAANNCRLEHIWRVNFSTFPRNCWSCLDTLETIVFVKNKYNVIECEEMLHGRLLSFVTEIGKTKGQFFSKTMFLFIQLPLQESGFEISV